MALVDSVAIKISGFMLIEPSKKYFSCSKIQQRQKKGPFFDTLSVKETSHATARKSWQWQGEVAKNYFPSLSLCFSFLRESEALGQILGDFFPHPVPGILVLKLKYPEQRRKTRGKQLLGLCLVASDLTELCDVTKGLTSETLYCKTIV